MAVFKLKIKEITEDRIQKDINLGREEAYKEVLEWLDETTIDDADDVVIRLFLFLDLIIKNKCFNHLKNDLILNNYETPI